MKEECKFDENYFGCYLFESPVKCYGPLKLSWTFYEILGELSSQLIVFCLFNVCVSVRK